MEIAELVAVTIEVDKKEDCWYCKEKKKKDEHKSNIARGDVAGKRDKIQSKSGLSWTDGRYGDMYAEAHHLIPVKSMARISSLHKYIEKKHGTIDDDIGYDLNHPNNSVWLPGRPVPPKDSDKIALINEANSQIHNSGHPDYRANIRGILDELYNKIKKGEAGKKCPMCDSEMDSKQKAPYGLVGRLDAISRKMKGLLTGIPKKWLLDEGYYTFSRTLKAKAKTWIKNGVI